MCVMAVTACDHGGGGGGGKIFWFTFFLLGLHIVPLRQQPINETSRSFPEKDAYHATTHEQTHAFCPPLCWVHMHRHSRTRLCKDTHIYHTGRDALQLSLHASLRLFMTSGDSKVNQLFFDWFDLVLTVCSHAYPAAVKSSNGLHFMQQECQTQLPVSTAFSPSSLLFVFTCPPPALQLCRSDGWYINGTCAE